MPEQMPANVPQEFPAGLEQLNQEIDLKADVNELNALAQKAETPSSMAPTLMTEKTRQFNALEDASAHAQEIVPEKDIVGPLASMGAETIIPTTRGEDVDLKEYEEPHKTMTLKTDATIALEKEAIAVKAPTVRSEATMELKASQAQTFKTGETIAREDAVKEAAQAKYEEHVASEKTTLRKLNEGFMEYDAMHDRITQWLGRLEQLIKQQPTVLPELAKLYTQVQEAKEAVEKQLDLNEYAVSKAEPGATPFKVEVPAQWHEIEAKLNTFTEGLKSPTVRLPALNKEDQSEVPTLKGPVGPEATA